MIRLLNANLTRLFKSVLFWVSTIGMAAMGVLACVMRYLDLRKHAAEYEMYFADEMNIYNSPDSFLFVGGMYNIFAIAVLVTVFIGTEYSDGTIRNKLVAGFSRAQIYLSNLITSVIIGIIIQAVYVAATYGVGSFILDNHYLTIKQIAIYTLSTTLSLVALSGLYTMFSMVIQSKAWGAIVALLAAMIMFFATLTIYNLLSAPEMYPASAYYDPEIGEIVMEEESENPNYIRGTKRKVLEFFDSSLPSSQIYHVLIEQGIEIDVFAIYSTILMVTSTGIGVILFRCKNLR